MATRAAANRAPKVNECCPSLCLHARKQARRSAVA
eukprot:CAMPEP_0202392658 /NCGR_PEP_ID=MMETSP1127-20130417/92495_2 /ASSEMBLY_ACC=CAM_ASM_000462 /TAXON_ID=3047 /ORGANISM="Dunaliella tertiolecta, Strain CCMP1320" /LENGTH=34 /DNA_ID= /DNA_START= /DNA_END= /DNA_ORIENTATION=